MKLAPLILDDLEQLWIAPEPCECLSTQVDLVCCPEIQDAVCAESAIEAVAGIRPIQIGGIKRIARGERIRFP